MSASREPRGLTQKQRKFVKFYVESGKKAESAVKAGYSEHTAAQIAAENLTKPNIKKAIEREERRIDAEHDVSVGWRLEMLKAIVQEGAGGTSLSAAVSALAEINRMTGGHAATKVEQEVKAEISTDITISKDEMDDILDKL